MPASGNNLLKEDHVSQQSQSYFSFLVLLCFYCVVNVNYIPSRIARLLLHQEENNNWECSNIKGLRFDLDSEADEAMRQNDHTYSMGLYREETEDFYQTQ